MKSFSSMYVLLTIFGLCLHGIYASTGDRSPFYQKCVHKCSFANCTGDGEFRVVDKQPTYLQLMFWSCNDECRYDCMWNTVDSFVERGWGIPQFHGKWPFVRILGVQEMASAIFSLMNFFAHLLMLRRFRKEVRKQSPMYWVWHLYAAVCLNAWTWSTVFHARDVDFTERMDYYCAFSMVLFSFYAMTLRFLRGSRMSMVLSVLMSLLCLVVFAHHITYLHMVHFDYGYNMIANISVGVATAVGWLGWSFWYRRDQPHVWRCVLFVLLAGLCMLFELADFPPLFWIVDAHSLWHLGTVGLPYVFYRFLIDDCKYLRKQLYLEVETIPMKTKSN